MFDNIDKCFKQIDYEPMDEYRLVEFTKKVKDISLEYCLKKYGVKRAYEMPYNGFVIIIDVNNNVTAYDPTGYPTGFELIEIEAVHYFYKEMGLLNEVKNGI